MQYFYDYEGVNDLLFEQIASNKRKSFYFVGCFILFVLIVGSAITYATFGNFGVGAIIAFICMVFYVPISLMNGTKIVMKLNHGRELTSKQHHPQLWNVVEDLSMVARIPTPKIYIIQEGSPNAFATGATPKKAAIAVTTGLLEKLTREELEAVIAHEIAHIQNYDIRLLTISLALVSVIAFLSDIGIRMVFGSDSKGSNPVVLVIALVLVILSPLIAMVIQLALARNREYLADATGEELCRNPHALASALEKISNDNDPVDDISRASACLYISEPFKKKRKKNEKTSLFATHPPVEKRIQRLLNM